MPADRNVFSECEGGGKFGVATPKPANSVPTASSSLGKVEPLQKLSYITERVPGTPRRLPGSQASALAGSSQTPRGRSLPGRSTRALCRHRLELVELVGSTVIAPSDIQQLSLWIWQAAFRRDTSKPMRNLSVMLPILLRPTIPIGGDILQCGRVFI